VGGNGGSGIVIVRYVTAGSPTSTYTVVYDGNGADSGAPPDRQSKTQNVAVVVAGNTGNLARTDFTFVGWNTATNSMGTDCVPGLTYEANASLTLYAKWAPATTILTLAAGSGGAVQNAGAWVVTRGVAIGIVATAAEGYVFTAWKVMSGAATFADIQAATTTVAITAPATIQAYFAPINPPSGTVWSWGQNTYGQLGDGTNINRVLPVQTIGLSNVTAMAAPSAGGSTFGLSSNGTVWAWGYNNIGQLGDGTKTNLTSPTQVRLTDGSPLSNVVAMAAAGYSTYALHSNSTIWAWGANNYGQLGDGTKANRLFATRVILPDGSPLSNVVAMAAAGNSAYALHSNSTIWAWGYNNVGQLGDGTKTNRTSATQVRLPDGVPLSNVVAIVAGAAGGGYDTMYALKRDGSLYAWGDSTFGQLGDGTNINRSTPVQVLGLSNIAAVASSGYSTYALHTNGTLWACGWNNKGQLGDGTTSNRSTFVQVAGVSNITAIARSINSAFALDSDNMAWAWGWNYYGQLGDGTTGNRLVPTPVVMSDGSQLSNVASIVTSGGATYALMRDGRLCSWGDNSSGQLGDGTTRNRLNPVQVKSIDGTTTLSGVARVCANGNGVLVIRNLTASGGNVSELAGAAAPSGLTATALATNRIELAWTDSATNEAGYVVDRSTDSNAWESVTVTSANATNASSTGLTTNTLYYFRVAARNAAGLSAYGYASARTWTVYEAWQRSHFGGADLNNLSLSGATADPDHDGLNNEQEYWAGTIPTNAASCLVLYALTNNPAAPGEYVVWWQSATGRLYTVQAASNLVVVGFTNIATHLPATPPVNVHTDNVSSVGCRFYRVQVE
jgi:uncharacterized repeat protein (TIGR02543 family)